MKFNESRGPHEDVAQLCSPKLPDRKSLEKLSDGMGLQGISNISFAGYLRSKEIVLATEQSSYNGEPSTVPASEMLAC